MMERLKLWLLSPVLDAIDHARATTADADQQPGNDSHRSSDFSRALTRPVAEHDKDAS